MTIDLSAWGELLERFGLPIVMGALIIVGSLKGLIIWRGSHDAIIALWEKRVLDKDNEIIELKSRLIAVGGERDRLWENQLPMARALEKGVEALKQRSNV